MAALQRQDWGYKFVQAYSLATFPLLPEGLFREWRSSTGSYNFWSLTLRLSTMFVDFLWIHNDFQ